MNIEGENEANRESARSERLKPIIFNPTNNVSALFSSVGMDENRQEGLGMTQGEFNELGSRIIRFVNFVRQEKPDVLFFLDKSARPIVPIVKEVLSALFPNEPLLPILFMNEGREIDDKADVRKHEEGRIKEAGKKLGRRFNNFKGKKVMLVDDVMKTGYSLRQAQRNLVIAYPGIPEEAISTIVLFRQPQFWSDPRIVGDPQKMGVMEMVHRDKDGNMLSAFTDFTVGAYNDWIRSRANPRRENFPLVPWPPTEALMSRPTKDEAAVLMQQAGRKTREFRETLQALGRAIAVCATTSSQ